MTKQDVVIRAVEPEDYEALQDIHSQPKVIWGTAQVPLPSKAMWRDRMAHPGDGFYQRVAVIDGRVVAISGLSIVSRSPRRTHAASLGMSVHDDFHGRGLGTALLSSLLDLADNWLNLRRIDLKVYVDNTSAIALYEKLGFEIEGRLRQYAFREGDYIDAYAMARLNT
jgi:putative acetyltransferase